MTWKRWTGALVVTAALLAGCGDDGGSPLDAGSGSGSGSGEVTRPGSGGGSSGGGIGGSSANAFCADGIELGKAFEGAARAAFGGGESGDDLGSTMKQLNAFYAELVKNAPSEIRADFQVLAEWWGQYSALLAKYDYDFMKLMADPDAEDAFDDLDDEAIEEASDNISAWIDENCPGFRD